jgi:hypothetical protein
MLIRTYRVPFFLLITSFYGITLSFAQSTKLPKALQRLIHHPGPIPIILGGNNNILPKEKMDGPLKDQSQSLVKTYKRLYCNIDGTGWLYDLTDSSGWLQAKRIDSTYYQGNNFGALHFSLGDAVYSLGGYGFWRTNGLLRRFNDYTHEWDIVKIDKEIPYSKGYLNWLDTASQKLYFSLLKFHQDGFRNADDLYKMYQNRLFVLDIPSGHWSSFTLDRYFNGIQMPCKWGTLSLYGPDSVLVLNYLTNEQLLLQRELIPQFQQVFTAKRIDIFYCIDTTLYFGNFKYDLFDSIRISEKDLIHTGKRFYHMTEKKAAGVPWKTILYLLLVFLIIPFSFYYLRKLYLSNRQIKIGGSGGQILSGNGHQGHAPNGPIAPFSPMERTLIQALFDQSTVNEDLTQEELNKVLGLSMKKQSVQKKNRNDIINSINQKWGLLQQTTEPLIDRKRSPDDMRIYSYSINTGAREDLVRWLSDQP